MKNPQSSRIAGLTGFEIRVKRCSSGTSPFSIYQINKWSPSGDVPESEGKKSNSLALVVMADDGGIKPLAAEHHRERSRGHDNFFLRKGFIMMGSSERKILQNISHFGCFYEFL